MNSLALTDHGVLYGAVEFYQKAHELKEGGIKPIIGMEAYVAETSRFEKHVDNRPSRIYHLTLLVRNTDGYKNLIKLTSSGFTEGFYRKPRLDLEILGRHSEGLIALSGCLSGRVPRSLLYGDPQGAEQAASAYREIFGRENFFIEIMENGLKDQNKVKPGLCELARKLDIPLVATNDIHYIEREDALVQEVLLCIQRNQTLNDEKRMRMGTDQFYFRSGREMIELFAHTPEAVENTALIAERCNLEMEFGKYHIPEFKTESGERPEEMLKRLCFEGARNRYGELTGPIRDRLEYELEVINSMGFVSYFLIVWDFIRYAKENQIPVGPGRGSAAGSVVAYSLDITELDPLKYDLLFERFLNSSRISMPDIDIDFCINGREKVVNYVREKYGTENVCQIITFGTMAAKGSLRDAGRILDIDLPTVDLIAKKIPNRKPADETRSLLEMVRDEDQELKKMRKSDPRIEKLFDISLKIEGLNRHPSTHAAGVVITDKPLTDYVPLCRVKDEINTQYQMTMLEDIGLLKMDFLGLKNLTIIDKALGLIETHSGVKIDLADLPLDDEKAYRLLQEGATQGIFQLESEGMRNLLVRLCPDCIEDIIALLALYRPGPLDSGMADLYVERKHGRQKTDTLHELLASILRETYGVIVYQEQVMRIANIFSGFSLNDADGLRKAMSKKKPKEMLKFRSMFIEGAVAKGVKEGKAEEVFDKIEAFARYGFNKSHSAAYAMITYQTTYLKANYPIEYMAALMSCDASDSDKIAACVEESERMDIKVLGPDFRESTPDFSISDKTIRFGLNAVKGLGEKAAEAIVIARKDAGEFEDVPHMLEHIDLKCLNKLALETLIKAGAFDSTGISRASYFDSVEQLLAVAAGEQKDRRNGQASLFGDDENYMRKPSIPIREEWDDTFKMMCEKESLGFILTSNPMKRFAPLLNQLAPTGPEDLKGIEEGASLFLGGMIETPRITMARRGRNAGKKIALFKIRTLGGRVSCVLFSGEYEKFVHLLQEDRLLFLGGALNHRMDDPSLIVSEILELDEAIRKQRSTFVLRLGRPENVKSDSLDAIREICSQHPGDFDLVLHFDAPRTNGPGYTVKAGSQYNVAPTLQTLLELEKVLGGGNVQLR